MSELKPCPFCGGSAKLSAREAEYLGQLENDGVKVRTYFIQVICNHCKSRGKPVKTIPIYGDLFPVVVGRDKTNEHYVDRLKKLIATEQAISAWNRRV